MNLTERTLQKTMFAKYLMIFFRIQSEVTNPWYIIKMIKYRHYRACIVSILYINVSKSLLSFLLLFCTALSYFSICDKITFHKHKHFWPILNKLMDNYYIINTLCNLFKWLFPLLTISDSSLPLTKNGKSPLKQMGPWHMPKIHNSLMIPIKTGRTLFSISSLLSP